MVSMLSPVPSPQSPVPFHQGFWPGAGCLASGGTIAGAGVPVLGVAAGAVGTADPAGIGCVEGAAGAVFGPPGIVVPMGCLKDSIVGAWRASPNSRTETSRRRDDGGGTRSSLGVPAQGSPSGESVQRITSDPKASDVAPRSVNFTSSCCPTGTSTTQSVAPEVVSRSVTVWGTAGVLR